MIQIFTIELGGQKIVVVSGYDAMHELLVKNADYASNKTVRTLPYHYGDIAKVTPGKYPFNRLYIQWYRLKGI